MKRKLLMILMLALPCYARTVPAVGSVEGVILHTMQSAWKIADTERSGDTQATALGATERTKLLVDAVIAAASSGDDNISLYVLPSKGNAIRLRALGITDGGTRTDQIYLGTLGGGKDCELTHAGQLAWVTGTQQSIYDQITFTSGGPYVPKIGETVTGNQSGKTAVIVDVLLSTNTWAGEDATGTLTYRSASGTFTGGETIKIVNRLGVTQADVLTHAGTDLIDFELADTVVLTAGAWGSSWTITSPANDTNAEAEIDVKGADLLVVVTTASSVDTKLLIKEF